MVLANFSLSINSYFTTGAKTGQLAWVLHVFCYAQYQLPHTIRISFRLLTARLFCYAGCNVNHLLLIGAQVCNYVSNLCIGKYIFLLAASYNYASSIPS